MTDDVDASTAWARRRGWSSTRTADAPRAAATFLERLRGGAEPLPSRQRAVPPERRTPRDASRPRRCCAPRSPPGCGRRSCTGGLVDPTLVPALEAAGYDRTPPRARAPARARRSALAPPRDAATPDPQAALARASTVDRRTRSAARPGVRLDTGGTGKGLAADLLARAARARRPAGRSTAAATCASARGDAPFAIDVRHPLTGETIAHARASTTARSPRPGIDVRLWRAPGRHAPPPPARPGHRRAGLDRPDRRHRARADRARGRGARQGRAAERPGPAPTLAAAATAAWRSATTATSTRFADDDRRPRTGG